MTPGENGERARAPYRLGIDLGSGSIGWAAVVEREGAPSEILAMGVRRFDAGVLGDIEQGKDESRATARRDARGPRRQAWRRQYRLRKVFRLLQKMDLLPPSKDDSHDERHRVLAQLDRQLRGSAETPGPASSHLLPYLLRARALDEKLSRHELGRALSHLAQRRGFQTNLKAAKKDEEVGVVKKGISDLENLMEQAGSRTLGEYLASLDPQQYRIRGRWTSRKMYQDEFNQIWTAQSAYHSDLTDEDRDRLYHAIFDQRPLKSQKGLIGICELEPNKRRAPAACLEFQEFRILQRVNDLEVIQPDGECRALNPEERTKVLGELAEKGEVTFGRIRTLLKMRPSREYGRNYAFNLEEGGEKRLVGNRTAAKLVAILGDGWRELGPEKQRQLVNEILSFESEAPLIGRLESGWGFEPHVARAVAETPLEPGYAALSRKAMRTLLPLLAESVAYATARKEVYGDVRRDQEVLDTLPAKHECAVLRNLRNPAVARALSELRKVVNALVGRYGKPVEVHIELARDLKHSRDRRKRMADQNQENEKSRAAARRKILEEMGDERYCTDRNVLKVRLADECNWECPYTGKCISMEALVGDQPQFDVEHIIPFSRSLDNSFLNKTLCYHEENRKGKRGRTPFEAYGRTPQWEEILSRVRRFRTDARTRKRKLELFQVERLPDTEDFTARQLSDTRYMSRLAADYLGLLFGGQIDVEGHRRIHVSPGRVTAYLRQRWNLNAILGHPDDKERDDHRHHAIDALVVALAGPREVHLLSRAAEEAEELGETRLFPRDAFDPPWDAFLDQARQTVEAIHVSSRVSRKLSGKLHKETTLSKRIPVTDSKGRVTYVHHVRKKLDDPSFSTRDIAKIVDDRIRRIVAEHLDRNGGDLKKAFSDRNNHPCMRAKDARIIPVQIHRVRIRTSAKPIVIGKGTGTRYVVRAPHSNHHMEVVAIVDGDGNETHWEGCVVDRLQAMECKRNANQIIQRDHGKWKMFKFSLTRGEHVVMAHKGGNEGLYRVTGISEKEVEFVLHYDARPTKVRRKAGPRVRGGPDQLREWGARKVAVDPLGNILPAND
ncbi:MAG TPA: type II CRISPR RNA-guided endonuclease Cas9 [Thermoguttaceae bacterium]|nr:type II CRISPR RNA-guided endonuclease Cas9 [Thermoguttaceae bacterium]